MIIELQPVGRVETDRAGRPDDRWGGQESCIVLDERYPAEALAGLAEFSHAEVIFQFHEIPAGKVVTGARHPRDNEAWPRVGIFAQRGSVRPNRLGATICRVLRVDGRRLHVAELDALDGSPVLDVKPVMHEFLPREAVRQPAWAAEVMRDYWRRD